MGKGSAEGCAACAKWLLIIFNVLFCLLGIGLVATGASVYATLSPYFSFVANENVNLPAIFLIVFGVITFIVAAIGCLGACKESPCLLFTFAAIVGVIVLAEIIIGAVAFARKDDLEEWVTKNGDALIKNVTNGTDRPEGVMATWNAVQKKLECCGFNGKDDWKDDVPNSCKSKDTGEFFTKNCKDAVIEFLKQNVVYVGVVGVVFGVIELLGIVFACCVGCAARKGEYA